MASVLVLGYGNTLRGDDGVGRLAAETLASAQLFSGLTVLSLPQLNPELAEAMSSCHAVLFLDSARGGIPGDVHCSEVLADGGCDGFTHEFTPAALLALCRELYGRVPAARELTLCGTAFGLSEQLSPPVAAAMPQFLRTARKKALELSGVPLEQSVRSSELYRNEGR